MTEPTVYEKALALKEIDKRLAAVKKPVDAEARECFERDFEPGDRKTVWREIDGQRVLLGDVSMDRPGEPSRTVTNDEAFRAWVTERFPERLRTRTVEVVDVDPEFVKEILEDGHVINPMTGEILTPAGVEWTTPRKPAFRVNPAPGIVEVLQSGVARLLELEGPSS